MIQVMADDVKQPLHNMLKTSNFSFYGMRQRTSLQMSNSRFMLRLLYNNVVSEHFIGLISISKVVDSSLSAHNVLEALEQFFIKRDISLLDLRFACMDTTL